MVHHWVPLVRVFVSNICRSLETIVHHTNRLIFIGTVISLPHRDSAQLHIDWLNTIFLIQYSKRLFIYLSGLTKDEKWNVQFDGAIKDGSWIAWDYRIRKIKNQTHKIAANGWSFYSIWLFVCEIFSKLSERILCAKTRLDGRRWFITDFLHHQWKLFTNICMTMAFFFIA